MDKKRSSTKSAFSRKAVDTTVVVVGLISFVVATLVLLLVAMPKSRSTGEIQVQIDDYTQSTADLNARLGAALGGQTDPTTAKLQELDALKERLSVFDHSYTPTTQIFVPGAPSGVTYTISVLTTKGAPPSGVVLPGDFYNGSGQGEYVRYNVNASASSSAELAAFAQSIQESPKLMQLVNPRISYTPTSQTGSLSEIGNAFPWTMSAELWVWGRQETKTS